MTQRLLIGVLVALAAFGQAQTYKFHWEQGVDPIGAAYSSPVGFVLDAGGNAYVVGTSKPTYNPGKIFLTKINVNGVRIWTHTYGGSLGNSASGVVLAKDGSGVYVAGAIQTSAQGWNGLLVKVSVDGAHLWSYQYDGKDHLDDLATKIAADSVGGAVLIGRSRNAAGSLDAFTTRVDKDRHVVYRKVFDGGGRDEAIDLTLSSTDIAYVAMTSERGSNFDTRVVAYSATGNVKWQLPVGDGGIYADTGLRIHLASSLYLAGRTYNDANLWDFYLAKISPSGTIGWYRTYHVSYDDVLSSVIFGPSYIHMLGTSLKSVETQGLNITAMRLSLVTGNVLWQRSDDLSSGKDDEGIDMGLDPYSGGPIVVGRSRTADRLGSHLDIYSIDYNGKSIRWGESSLGRTAAAHEEPVAIVPFPLYAFYVLITRTDAYGKTQGRLIRFMQP